MRPLATICSSASYISQMLSRKEWALSSMDCCWLHLLLLFKLNLVNSPHYIALNRQCIEIVCQVLL